MAFSKSAVLALARKIGVVVTAGVATWAVSPAALNIVPTKYDFVVASVVAPLLWELNKKLGGKGTPTPTPTPPAPTK